jgi:wobble nucleotide-excising tRNase
MIESIRIADIATYGSSPEIMNGISKFTFLYGSNGTGKTTISKVIADEGRFPSCSLTWKGGTKLQAMVYNRDFVLRNFSGSTELKGIFTLGETNVDALKAIEVAKTDYDLMTRKMEKLTETLQGENGTSGKSGELAILEGDIKDKCWVQKVKHDAKFSDAFKGFRNSAENFKVKIIDELASNAATLEVLEELEKRAETVFGQTPTTEKAIPVLETADIVAHESNLILKKRVIGKEDVDIAAMIQKLGNSDWVREGRVFYESNDKLCPFCQKSTSEAFEKGLNDYFDGAFERDRTAIDKLEIGYKSDSERLRNQIELILAAPPKPLDVQTLIAEKALLDSKITVNIQRLATKRKEPSHSIALEPLSTVLSAIKALLDAANSQIFIHNKMVDNLTQERRNLTAQVWKYLLEVVLKADIAVYVTKRDGLSKAINALKAQIAVTTKDRKAKAIEIQALERGTTSIQPTINGINALLSSFGFRGFSLAQANIGTHYKLVRTDGTDAKETLSEGERTFVTFLYFYHLLKGSDSESGMTTDRVVVFDDPVSSLDSDILFIVGSLIKGLFEEVRDETGHIKQIFVFTHNVYFHKEVTFNPNRRNEAMNEETFWTIRKSGSVSRIEKHNSNPIKTSYELLWAEVRKPDPANLTIQNTLRRILENYFKILGRVDPDEICQMFEGTEKFICRSLFSWVNDGSHYALDDLYVTNDDSTVETNLKMFRAIFEKSGHQAHYRMMMGNEYVESLQVPSAV